MTITLKSVIDWYIAPIGFLFLNAFLNAFGICLVLSGGTGTIIQNYFAYIVDASNVIYYLIFFLGVLILPVSLTGLYALFNKQKKILILYAFGIVLGICLCMAFFFFFHDDRIVIFEQRTLHESLLSTFQYYDICHEVAFAFDYVHTAFECCENYINHTLPMSCYPVKDLEPYKALCSDVLHRHYFWVDMFLSTTVLLCFILMIMAFLHVLCVVWFTDFVMEHGQY